MKSLVADRLGRQPNGLISAPTCQVAHDRDRSLMILLFAAASIAGRRSANQAIARNFHKAIGDTTTKLPSIQPLRQPLPNLAAIRDRPIDRQRNHSRVTSHFWPP